jgi:hypothetical protein
VAEIAAISNATMA